MPIRSALNQLELAAFSGIYMWAKRFLETASNVEHLDLTHNDLNPAEEAALFKVVAKTGHTKHLRFSSKRQVDSLKPIVPLLEASSLRSLAFSYTSTGRLGAEKEFLGAL